MSESTGKKSKPKVADKSSVAKVIRTTTSKLGPMIEGKSAAQAAAAYLKALNPNAGAITVEELERENAQGSHCWIVTLSYRETVPSNHPASIFEVQTQKVYKVFRVDVYSGEVLSMKIRTT
ncbi:MAG: hypothetical protein HY962_04855 [Ignavibacteriae bacterium]|nr:hypothetical protein [Ignavibacteriota bacterium]